MNNLLKHQTSHANGLGLHFSPTGRSFFLLALSTILLSACIIIPVPAPDKVLAGRAVSAGQQAGLKDGVTTRQEVIARLGNPDVIWVEARVFCYNWTTRHGILLHAIPGGAGSVGARDLARDYVFLVQFDANDRLVRHAQVARSQYPSYGHMLREWASQPVAKPGTGPDNDTE